MTIQKIQDSKSGIYDGNFLWKSLFWWETNFYIEKYFLIVNSFTYEKFHIIGRK